MFRSIPDICEQNGASPEHRQKLSHIILVELLAYQFMSPIR